MANPWGRIGAWAADAERAEEEAKLQQTQFAAEEDFPSLGQAAAAPKPKKKNKGQKLTLSELQSGQHIGPGAKSSKVFSDSKGLTVEELLVLPKAPREKTAEELQEGGRWSGSFRTRGFSGSERPEGRRSYGSSFNDEERTRPSRIGGGYGGSVSDREMPSRADEVDNWGAGKTSLPPPPSRRYEGDRFDSGSRADDVDNWGSVKKFTPGVPPPSDRRSMGFGSSYRDPRGDSFRRDESFSQPASERPKLVLNPRTVPLGSGSDSPAPTSNRPSPFGSARPREEVLAEKAMSENGDENKYSSRPTSADSSQADSVSGRSESAQPKARPKVNPFGEAKPREAVLAERGVDYRKIDLDIFRAIGRSETPKEMDLKKEVNNLRMRLTRIGSGVSENGKSSSGDDQNAIKEELEYKEKELEILVKELNDKARLERKNEERPGSGAGRNYEFFERPGSHSGHSEGGRSFDSLDRPRSRGGESRGPEVWTRAGEERRSVNNSRGLSFSGRRSETGRRW
eukprot:TRINITY_DN7737_c0_g2_i1.p1 TRINITY_DN7737_c0_g2~~TRINITY_DN7737_c0_g2_i1.p1  ORF type:complete len:584 (-),score=75.33 TRINITY_DN7737_c0_g2_i1:315-1850(-)